MSLVPSPLTRLHARSHPLSWRAGLAGVLVCLSPAAIAQSGLPGSSASSAPPPEAGVWFDEAARGAVEIRPCGDALCGHIVWLKEPTDARGAPLTDAHNPDPSKRARPICGLQVIGNVKPQGDGTWDEGWVYDPKAGKAYDVAIDMSSRDRLTVTGYKGVKFLSRTLVWTRAPADLPRCAFAQEASGTGPLTPPPRRP